MTIKYTFSLLIQAPQDTHDVSTSMHISCKGTPLIPLKYGYFLLFFFFEVFLADFFFDFFLKEQQLRAEQETLKKQQQEEKKKLQIQIVKQEVLS